MFGLNAFYDEDIKNEHARASLGLEVKGSILDFSANKYQKATNMKVVDWNRRTSFKWMGLQLIFTTSPYAMGNN